MARAPWIVATLVWIWTGSAGAVLPAGELPVGPPARLHDYDPAAQARLTAGSDPFWRLPAEEGGRWFVRWDEWTGVPRVLWAPGVPWDAVEVPAEAAALLARHADLWGVPAGQLTLDRDVAHGDRRSLHFAQVVRGVPVEGAGIDLRLRRGGDGIDRLGMIRVGVVDAAGVATVPALAAVDARHAALADLAPVALELRDEGSLVIFPGAPDAPPRPRLAWRVIAVDAAGARALVTFVDALDGAVLYRYDDVRRDLSGSLAVQFEQRSEGDPEVTAAAPYLTVESSQGVATADALGAFALPGGVAEDLAVTMEGPRIRLEDRLVPGDVPLAVFAGAPGPGNDFTWDDAGASFAARDVLAHTEVVRGWTELRAPGLSWLGDQLLATVNIDSSACNAFYYDGTISFYGDDPGENCANFGRIADIVYHEYGHGIHHFIIETGSFDGTVSEGSADYVSATIWDDPIVAPGAWGPGTYIRELDTDKVYPDDVVGEVHADGLIWGSAMWDLREAMIALYGYDDGVEAADGLFLGALRGGPTLTDTFDELAWADDDDGDLTNGTPHLCLLLQIMGDHGLGPGDLGYFLYQHTPLEGAGNDETSYPIEAHFEVLEPACSDLDPGSVALQHAIDVGGPWQALAMSWDGVSGYGAAIPRYPAGATVRYLIQASDSDGDTTWSSHGGDPDQLYAFFVGDLETVACDDLEGSGFAWEHASGAPGNPGQAPDDWELGTPAGLASDPDHAASGDRVWGTDLGDGTDGEYRNNTSQFLRLPAQDLSWTDRPRLQYRRWLTVEDGFYDHARVVANDQVLWENPWTQGGGVHFLDHAWVLHDLPLADVLDGQGAVWVAWTLQSDQGLEFGGWNVDDVCLRQMDDLPGLYTVDDLEAGDGEDGQATLTWTQPWAVPLWAVAVVRHPDHFPQDLDDGVVVHLDTEPQWGAAVEVVDSDLEAGRTYHYTVFAADGEWAWRSEVAEGHNADTATVAAAGDDDDSAGDDDAADDDDSSPPPADPGDVIESTCACRVPGQGPPATGIAWLLAGLAGLARLAARRRRPE